MILTPPISLAASLAPLLAASKKPLPSAFGTSPTRVSAACPVPARRVAATAARISFRIMVVLPNGRAPRPDLLLQDCLCRLSGGRFKCPVLGHHHCRAAPELAGIHHHDEPLGALQEAQLGLDDQGIGFHPAGATDAVGAGKHHPRCEMVDRVGGFEWTENDVLLGIDGAARQG